MAAEEEISCKELVELVTDYLEGVLPSEERARFEEHLSQCPGCEIYLEQMRQIIRTMGKLSEDSTPPPARETLLQAFRSWKQTR